MVRVPSVMILNLCRFLNYPIHLLLYLKLMKCRLESSDKPFEWMEIGRWASLKEGKLVHHLGAICSAWIFQTATTILGEVKGESESETAYGLSHSIVPFRSNPARFPPFPSWVADSL